MSNVKGVAVIGTGVIYKNHAMALEAIPERARLIGVAELDESKLAAASQTSFVPVATNDYRELLDRGDVDIIAVCTPPSAHESIVRDALESGKYVICEKPLANNLAAVDRIVQLSEPYPGRLGTVYQVRYLPEIQEMIRLRDQGALGKLLFGHFQRYGYLRSTAQANVQWWGNWETAGGGVVCTQFIHLLDLMLYLYGKPTEVQAWMGTLKNKIESEDSFTATIQFENGATVSAVATLAAHHAVPFSLDVYGEDASVHYPWELNSTDPQARKRAQALSGRTIQVKRITGKLDRVLRIAKRASAKFLNTRRPAPPPNLHTDYYKQVLNAIDGEEALPISPQEARGSIELVTAIYESAILGQRVSLPLTDSSRFYEGITVDDYDGRKTTPEPMTA